MEQISATLPTIPGKKDSVKITQVKGNKLKFEINGVEESIKLKPGQKIEIALDHGDQFTVGRDVDLSAFDLLIRGTNEPHQGEWWEPGIRVEFEPGSTFQNVSIWGTDRWDQVFLINGMEVAHRYRDPSNPFPWWPRYRYNWLPYERPVTIKGRFFLDLRGSQDWLTTYDARTGAALSPQATSFIEILEAHLGEDCDALNLENISIRKGEIQGGEGMDSFTFGYRFHVEENLLLDGGEFTDLYNFSGSILDFPSERIAIRNRGDIVDLRLSGLDESTLRLETRQGDIRR